MPTENGIYTVKTGYAIAKQMLSERVYIEQQMGIGISRQKEKVWKSL